MRTLNLVLLTGVLCCPIIGVSQDITVPNTFQAGTPARASEVNENFSALVGAINANTAAISDDAGTDAASILDLSVLPVIVEQSGYYILDRDWSIAFDQEPLQIVADRVILDFRGFEIEKLDLPRGSNAAIVINGDRVTLRNGRVNAIDETAVATEGAETLIEGMWMSAASGVTVALWGQDGTIRASTIESGDATAIWARSNTTVQGNVIFGHAGSVRIDSSATQVSILDNDISCSQASFGCVRVLGSESIVARNRTSGADDLSGTAFITVEGSHNLILDNAFSADDPGGSAILVEGSANVVRGNIVAAPVSTASPWPSGIRFTRDGNFYGGNNVWAIVPFDLGATVQTDLGGNLGF